MNFTWIVDTIDEVNRTMVVTYTLDGTSTSTSCNVPIPHDGEDLAQAIDRYAPLQEWQRRSQMLHPVKVGLSSATVARQPVSDPLRVVGNWNEEYLRALIYQVLEEVNKSKV